MTELESDYVPHTDDVRAAYEVRSTTGPPAMAVDDEEARAKFNRWLAREKAAAVRAIARGVTSGTPIPPDIIRDALYIRADRIERGEGMSTVGDSIEAGARELLWQTVTAHPESASQFEWGRARRIVRRVQVKQWPILSAPLRELHTRWDQGGGSVVCTHCNDNTSPPRKKQWPCETITELDRIDRELGIETDNQSGDPS